MRQCREEPHTAPGHSRPPARTPPTAIIHREKCVAGAGRPSLGLRPRSVPPAPAKSHPDCRCRLILIVAPHVDVVPVDVSPNRLDHRPFPSASFTPGYAPTFP